MADGIIDCGCGTGRTRFAAMKHERFLILGACLMLAGCAHAKTPEGRAVLRASDAVASAISASQKTLADNPVSLKTRYNPCPCDPMLEFEVQLHEQWRHVLVKGSENAMILLKKKAAALENGAIFEADYFLDRSLYVSVTGQKYYTLHAQ